MTAQNSDKAQLCAREKNAAQEVSRPDYRSCKKMLHHKNCGILNTGEDSRGQERISVVGK